MRCSRASIPEKRLSTCASRVVSSVYGVVGCSVPRRGPKYGELGEMEASARLSSRGSWQRTRLCVDLCLLLTVVLPLASHVRHMNVSST